MVFSGPTAKISQQFDSESPLYIRFAKRADLAIAAGDHDLAVLLIDGAFLALDGMVCAQHNPP